MYDHAIIVLCYNKFITSDMQLGFKANHSTVMCSLVFHKIINNYLKISSNVYSCLLDASKAFDKVIMVNCLEYCSIKKFLFVLSDYY